MMTRVMLLMSCLTPCLVYAAEPLEISSQRQLFLDDFVVQRTSGLTHTLHQPEKRGPVLKAEQAWEGTYIAIFSPPMWIPEEGVYKQVYECRYEGYPGKQGHRYALAISQDGIHWEKPKLGLVDFGGSKRNNLFPTPGNRRLVHVVFDPDDPNPDHRYKGLLTIPRGRVPVVSPDCLHWTKLDTTMPSADAGTMAFDRENRLFMALLKRGNPNTVGRSYDVSFSEDFVNWSKPRLMFGMDKQRDQQMALDVIRRRLANPALARPLFVDPDPAIGWQRPEDKRHIPTWQAECYNFGVVPYEGIYLGLITVYYPTGQRLPERNNADGFKTIQLAMSRDLVHWKRLGDRQPFLETSPLSKGLVGNYDRLQLAAYNGIIQHGNEVRFYYGGNKRRVPQHDRWIDGRPRDPSTLSDSERADWLEDTHSAMHLSVLRRDGFVSLDAGTTRGELITKRLITTGSQLQLNVVTRDAGHAHVELLDDNNDPIPGFSMQESVTVKGNRIAQPVSWTSGADLAKLTGRSFRLRIALQNAELYSFQITAGG